MDRPSRLTVASRKLLLLIASSFTLLACSSLQPRPPGPPSPPDRPPLSENPASSSNHEDFSRSILDGSDRPGASPVGLLKNPQVKSELHLTEAQNAKLTEVEAKLKSQSRQIPNLDLGALTADQRAKKLVEISEQLQEQARAKQEEVASILEPKQLKRLKEITLQLYGWGILTSNQFNEELQITPEQQQQFIDLHQQMLQQISQNWPSPADQNSPEAKQVEREVFRQNMDRITRQTNQQALAILTPEQQKTLETLKGKKFELDFSQVPDGPGAVSPDQPPPGQ